MSEMFSIELSDETVRRVRDTAHRTGRPVEAILSEWIERDAQVNDLYPLVPGVEYPIYTPFGNEAAAEVLYQLLQETEEADKKTKP